MLFNHSYIVDTTSAIHVWEHLGYPQFYVPVSDLRNCHWSNAGDIEGKSSKPGAAILKISVEGPEGKKETDRVIHFLKDGEAGQLAGLVRLEFGSMDGWLEEDTPIYVHPKDPFKRVDILQSYRPVEVKVGGYSVAKTSGALHLLETGLPTRYYLPLSSVDQTLLRKSDLITRCPYKGEAQYYDVVVVGGETYKNLVWYYRTPTAESMAIAGTVCFYNEKVDTYLDGVLQERPVTHFG